MSPAQLEAPPLVGSLKVNEREQSNLMKTLLKQRPTRVSHLLQDNLPGSSKFNFNKDIDSIAKPVFGTEAFFMFDISLPITVQLVLSHM